MANGTLAQSNPAAATDTIVYTVPAGQTATASVNILNGGSNVAAVRVAISATGTPAASEYVELDAPIDPTLSLERTGLVISENKNLVVRCSNADCVVNVYGFEA